MPDEQAFVAALADSPDDVAGRLIFADWLDERGATDRAEFIRLQCELERLAPADPRYPDLHVRQLEMVAEHERDWIGESADRLVRWDFKGGLLHSVTITPEAFLGHGANLFARHPVQRVAFVNQAGASLSKDAVREVVAAPTMAFVRGLEVSGCRRDEPMWGMFPGIIGTNAWLKALAGAQHVSRLEELNLTGGTRHGGREPITLGAWRSFCAAGHLRSLRSLDLSNAYGHNEDEDRLAQMASLLGKAAFARALRFLSFEGYIMTDELERQLKEALGRWPVGGSDTQVSLPDQPQEEFEHLHQSPFLSRMRTRLDLTGRCTTLESVRLLAQSPALKGLRWLGFGYNRLTEEKMALLLASPILRHLEALHLGSESEYAGTSEAALLLLAQSKGLPRLRDVVVGSETPAGAVQALRKRFGPRLRVWQDY
jgi:uncharacterized protein (TIGR02996 family)